jgi:1-aminocyclopropane-1-carboxylate deaminase
VWRHFVGRLVDTSSQFAPTIPMGKSTAVSALEMLLDARDLGTRVPTPIERLELPAFSDNGLIVHVKRDDLIHPTIIGNKLRKSFGHFQLCRQRRISTVVTFGGRHSNHLLAVSQVGRALGFSTIGIVRGRDTHGPSPVLEECKQNGMRIVPVKAHEYYPLQRLSAPELNEIASCNDPVYVVPEGGTSEVSLEGTAAIVHEIEDVGQYAYIACAVGTGGTAAGLAAGLANLSICVPTRVLAIAVVRGYLTLPEQGHKALERKYGAERASSIVSSRIEFDGSAPFGRFGPPKASILAELRQLQKCVSFPLDSVYTGKLLLHIARLASSKFFVPGSKLLFLHTGGYQTAPLQVS